MSLWLLLKKPDETGDAIPLTPARNVISYGSPQYSFGIRLKPDNDNDLYRSANLGGQQGFALLWREGYVRLSVTARFELNAPPNVHGNSADLLFALAVITQTMKDKKYPPLAATGCLDEKSHVGKVEGVPAKIKAALAILPAGGIIFYPKANDDEINPALRKTAKDCKITLCPVDRLDQAADRLGIKINKVYLQSPYRGLEAFHAEHRSIYFGRQAEIEALTTLLLEREQKQTTGVLIIAASGTGKSSLVQAGLVPALQQGRLALQDRRVFSSVWQPSDIGESINESNLVKSLIANWQKQPELLAITHKTIPTLKKLSSTLEQKLPANRRFVWVLNQMEELFTLDFSEALLKTFCEFLQALQKIGVWVIATLRNDFYDRYQKQPALLTMFGSTGVYDLPAIDAASLRQIIEEPARLADVRFEINDKQISLVDRLLEDMAGNTEALPLLEFILQELHQARVDGVMTYDKYQQLNGLMGSIGVRAETVFSALNEQAQATLPRLLWKLAAKAKDDPRKKIVAQAVYLNDFATSDPIRYLITAFIEQRLLIQDNEKKQAVKVRVAHEALLTHWSRAKDIIDGFIADRQLYDQLQSQARDWQTTSKNHKFGSLIPTGLPLLKAEALLKNRGTDFLSEDVSKFIQASIVKKKIIIFIESMVILVILIFAVIAWVQKSEAQKQTELALTSEQKAKKSEKVAQEKKREAENQAKNTLVAKLGSQALLAVQQPSLTNGYPDQAFLLAAQAFKLAPDNVVAQSNLLNVLLASHINKYFDDGHQDNVTSIAYSPDGKRIVSGSHDSTLILWDVATGKVIGQPWKGHQNLVNSVAFSPDGKQVISGSNDGTLILWDAETGKAIGQPWQGSGEVKSVAFSPNGKQVISGDEQGTLIMWDVASRKPIRNQGVTLKDGRGINSVAFSPNGKQFLSGDGVSSDSGLTDKPNKPVERMFGLTKTDNVINKPSLILWDVEKFGNIIGLPWKGHSGVVQSVAFSPDGQYVISGGGTSGFSSVDKYYQYTNDYTLMLWDVSSGKSIGQPWQGHQGDVNSVAFSPNGHFVISGSRDKNLILWNTQNGKIVESPWQGHRSNVNSVAFSPDGNQVVSGGGSYMGVDKKFAAEYRIILWNIDNRMVIEIPWKNDGISVAFSPDGKQAVSVVDNINNTLMLWNVASGKPIGSSWQGHQGQVISIAFSPDGKRVISGSVDGTLILWDVENSKAIGKFWNDSNKLSIRSVAFSPNGEFVICGNSDGTLVLWNAKTGRIIGQPWQGHQGDIGSVAFSADSKQVISGGEDKTLVLWDVETGKAIGQPWRGHQGAVGSVAFSPGGSWVISGVGAFESRDDDKFDLILWDVETGKAIGQPWQGHQDAIHSVAFSPDGKRVISSGAGDTLVLWDVETGKVIGQPLEQSFYHNCCGSGFGFSNSAFSSDGKQVVSAKYGVFGLWDVDSENWAARACKKANRNFTRAEWNQFIGEDLLPYQKTCEQFPLKD